MGNARDSATNPGAFGIDEKLGRSAYYSGQGRYGRHPSQVRLDGSKR